jgi:hypothetical protein
MVIIRPFAHGDDYQVGHPAHNAQHYTLALRQETP